MTYVPENPGSVVPGLRLVDGADIAYLIAVANGQPNSQTQQAISASGAVNVSGSGPGAGPFVIITAGSAAALTLAAPGANQNGTEFYFISTTAFAHTVSAPGLLNNGGTGNSTATFAAHAGAGFTAIAYNGAWYVTGSQGITFT